MGFPAARALGLSFCVLTLSCEKEPATAQPGEADVARPLATSPAVPAAEDGPLQMAITVDDLPVHGPLPKGVTRLEIHQKILATLKAHKVPQVYGFANTVHIDQDAELEKSLKAWVEAGYPLGNHSYTHPHMRDVGVESYLKDIEANEGNLARLSKEGQDWHVYRYPFLEEGDDEASARRVREYLASKGYRVAEVTVDFYDWAFNSPYARCLETANEAGLAALRTAYIDHAAFTLNWADDAAKRLFARRVPQVLLLHAGPFDAEMLDALLTKYEAMGVEFISLDEALSDPVYSIVEIADDGAGGTLLEHLISTRGAAHPPWFTHPYALIDAMCR